LPVQAIVATLADHSFLGLPHFMPLRRSVTLALLMVLALGGCTSQDKKAANAAASAEMALRQGRNAEALRSIRVALAARDDVSDYWLLLGRIDTALNDMQGAFTAYENVIQLDRGNVEALRLLCQLGLNVGAPDKVDKYADQLLLLTPDDGLPIVMKGGAALLRGDAGTAEQLAEQVLKKNPQDIGALILKARVFASRGNFTEAASFIENSGVASADDGPRLSYLKELYFRASDRPHYQLTLQRLAVAKPKDATAQLDYADMLFQTGQGAAANAVIDKLMRIHPDDLNVAADILDVWLKQGPDALPVQEIGARAAKVSLEMKSAYAQFANETGHPEIAAAILAGNVSDAPPTMENSDAKAALAYAIALQRRRADGIGRLNEILSVDPAHPRALLARARLLASSGDLKGAISDARRVVSDDQRNVTARLALVDILIENGDADLAESSLREGVRAVPDDPRLASRLITILLGRGDQTRALDALRGLMRAAPVSLRALRLQATLDPKGTATAARDTMM
jgi:tetratricopeptide (TPR) repeat protein